MTYCSVVLVDPGLSHLDRIFTYAIPDGVSVETGALVRVPFRRRKRLGIVVSLLGEPDIERPLPIAGIVGPGLDPDVVDLAGWVAGRYLSTLGEALASVLPQRVAGEEASPSSSAATPAPGHEGTRFDEYTNGDRLARALREGGGGFVWRPASGGSRADAIASMVAASAARGGVLVLVPEVRVGSEVVRALASSFGDSLALLGSDRSARARYRDWLALRSGAKRIAVGSRAAVFAPIHDLSLIVVDEEGHQSYKEGRAPRYHARAVAAERARRTGATLVLVGVPPSVEARAATERGPYMLVSPSRAAEREHRPSVVVVEEGRLVPAAATLRSARGELDAGRRVVFITHRGGEDVAAAVERITRILAPRRLASLDADSTAADVAKAARGADCICATPFIAKDLRLDRIGCLALLHVDAALSQPEYRAGEDAFATWWRGARWLEGGRIVIETAEPSHPAVVALTRWDPDLLYRAEATRRRELGYPPFAALARIDVPAERAAAVADEVRATGVEVLGPAEREGHTVVVARARRRADLLSALGPLTARWRASEEPMRVDIDPWEVLVPKWRS
ncbi:MAG: primosomal protein N' family DNA-binding protein [Actinomycetota bacterium]